MALDPVPNEQTMNELGGMHEIHPTGPMFVRSCSMEWTGEETALILMEGKETRWAVFGKVFFF